MEMRRRRKRRSGRRKRKGWSWVVGRGGVEEAEKKE
jgi:hypothetical protein